MNCNVMNTIVGHVIAEYYYNAYRYSLPEHVYAIVCMADFDWNSRVEVHSIIQWSRIRAYCALLYNWSSEPLNPIIR
jgi:hypothetical protein